jgi:hypothetical protein
MAERIDDRTQLLGAKAFLNGIFNTPALDPDFIATLDGRSPDDASTASEVAAWHAGWTRMQRSHEALAMQSALAWKLFAFSVARFGGIYEKTVALDEESAFLALDGVECLFRRVETVSTLQRVGPENTPERERDEREVRNSLKQEMIIIKALRDAAKQWTDRAELYRQPAAELTADARKGRGRIAQEFEQEAKEAVQLADDIEEIGIQTWAISARRASNSSRR